MSTSNFTAQAEESFAPKTIEKEEVANLTFPKTDVLYSSQEKEQRKRNLVRATRAGNLEKIKFKITFEEPETPFGCCFFFTGFFDFSSAINSDIRD